MPFDGEPQRKTPGRYPAPHVTEIIAGWRPLEYARSNGASRRSLYRLIVYVVRQVALIIMRKILGRTRLNR